MRRTPETYRSALPDPGAGDVEQSYTAAVLSDDVKIRDYLRILYRRRSMLLGGIVAGALASILYNAQAARIFEASATLQIGADPNVLGLSVPLVDQRDWMREFLPTQLAVLESRELAVMAQEELRLSKEVDQIKRIPEAWEIVEGRSVFPVFNTRLVNIGFRSTEPATTAAVANALARAYVKWNTVSKSNTTGEASDWLKRQVEEQRKVVQATEAALQQYKKEHGAEALGERQNIVVQKLADLQFKVTGARADTIDRQTQYEQLAGLQSNQDALDTLPAIASNPYIQGVKEELAGLQQQLAQASDQLGELHPDIVKLKGSVQHAEQKLRTEISKQAAAIRNSYVAARARERALAAAFERQKVEVQELNAKTVEYTALDRAATANRLLLDNLEQRSKQITLARDLPSAAVSLLDPAAIPGEPIFPRKERNIVLGVMGGGALTLALIFLIEIFNTRVTSPDDVRRYLRIPVLGVTPHVKSLNASVRLLLGDGAPPQFAELLHGVRTNLVVAPEFATARTLLVTSSEPGEGKTVVAANLALSLARLSQRVLLVDSDLRRPRMHDLFAVAQQPGLTDVLTGGGVQNACQQTTCPGLWVMASGALPANPTDLLGSERFAKLTEFLRARFDWVIFDSPPVLAVTDPCLIGRVASGVLLVVGSGRTSRELAVEAVERLEGVGAPLVGAMLNHVVLEPRSQPYLSYYETSGTVETPVQPIAALDDFPPFDTEPVVASAERESKRQAWGRFTTGADLVRQPQNPWAPAGDPS
jgi:polysaccharide biosynthesis transport protein